MEAFEGAGGGVFVGVGEEREAVVGGFDGGWGGGGGEVEEDVEGCVWGGGGHCGRLGWGEWFLGLLEGGKLVVEGLLEWLLDWLLDWAMGLLGGVVDCLLKWLLDVSNASNHRIRKRLRLDLVSVVRPQLLGALRLRRGVILVTVVAAVRSDSRCGSAEECEDVHDAFLSLYFFRGGLGRYVDELFQVSGEN